MAQSTQPIPQHITALLSHLTSRPGIQSTLILSRKDGSIIQSTGFVSSSLPATYTVTTPTPPSSRKRGTSIGADESLRVGSDPSQPGSSITPNPQQQQQQPYQPSHVEALAAHIHSYVASATALSHSLSPHQQATVAPAPAAENSENGYGYEYGARSSSGGASEGYDEDTTGKHASRDNNEEPTLDSDNHEREGEDDEVKLLRLRTKKHEIVVVPDKKYLLCVIHDALGITSTTSSTGAGGGGSPSTSISR